MYTGADQDITGLIRPDYSAFIICLVLNDTFLNSLGDMPNCSLNTRKKVEREENPAE